MKIEPVNIAEHALHRRPGFERIHHGIQRARVKKHGTPGAQLDKVQIASDEQHSSAAGDVGEEHVVRAVMEMRAG